MMELIEQAERHKMDTIQGGKGWDGVGKDHCEGGRARVEQRGLGEGGQQATKRRSLGEEGDVTRDPLAAAEGLIRSGAWLWRP